MVLIGDKAKALKKESWKFSRPEQFVTNAFCGGYGRNTGLGWGDLVLAPELPLSMVESQDSHGIHHFWTNLFPLENNSVNRESPPPSSFRFKQLLSPSFVYSSQQNLTFHASLPMEKLSGILNLQFDSPIICPAVDTVLGATGVGGVDRKVSPLHSFPSLVDFLYYFLLVRCSEIGFRRLR